ncbi:MAG: hypothetical protein VKL42_14050 [Snowella sp.]|nr:hypothetical protein [Snowella sp.]
MKFHETIVIDSKPYLILTDQGQTLPPFELTKSKHILGRDLQIADLLVPDN